MDLSGYSAKDSKLIRENEGASPYQLLELGLSKNGYEKYMKDVAEAKAAPRPRGAEALPAEAGTQTAAEPEADFAPAGNSAFTPSGPLSDMVQAVAESIEHKPADAPITPETVQTKKAHQPRLNPPPARPATLPGYHTPQSVFQQVTIVGPSGIPQRMAIKQAQRLQRTNPQQYRILD